MHWVSLGLLYEPGSIGGCEYSHAALPTIFETEEGIYKIFYSVRDSKNRSHCAVVDFNMHTWTPGHRIISKNAKIALSPGPAGHFDDAGVSVSSFLRTVDCVFFYYLGWARRVNVPFSNQIGLAGLQWDYKLKRLRNTPIYGISEREPLTFGYPTIHCYDGETLMYYDGLDSWGEVNSSSYKFDLRIAKMSKANRWVWCGKARINMGPSERAITRPSFFTYRGRPHMVFSVDVSGNYGIAAAVLEQDLRWRRLSEFLFSPSGEYWDSYEVTYPNTFCFKENVYMLYNGNKYGKTGFGLALLQE